MAQSRRTGDRLPSILILLIVIGLLVGLWLIGNGGRSPLRHEPLPTPLAPTSTGTIRQPSVSGVEYLVTDERYVVAHEDGTTTVQTRRRESWRADDGWAWARQTGSDPGQFIFKPIDDWQRVRAVPPVPAEQQRVLEEVVSSVPPEHKAAAQFNFVADLLGAESLPAGSLPIEYRIALIDALDQNTGVTVAQRVLDPLERESTRLSFTDVQYRPDVEQSIFFDQQYQYLGYLAQIAGTDQRGSRIVLERRYVDRIPDELLAVVGTDRVEKVLWD